jgi:phosphoribosylglycinamide formyltransferase-1
MADCAVFASGNGSNFEALAERIAGSGHRITCLVCDNPRALVIEGAKRFSIPVLMVDYGSGSREEAENAILEKLRPYAPELIVLAGFMRILTPRFLASFPDRVVNIHPTLLPKHPGTRGIEESYASRDRELGITIHYVDSGVDTGPIILQRSFTRNGTETIDEIERRIHALEHQHYPIVVLTLLNRIQEEVSARGLLRGTRG